MEIGTIVKVDVSYRLGEKKKGKVLKEGKIIAIYPNFILIEFKGRRNEDIYRESYKENEIIF